MQYYFIRAKIEGKIKYWDRLGLHSGKSELRGYSIYKSVAEANKDVRRLKILFHSWIEWEVLPESEIPFIKKQIKARK
jgi:hypothetical protein